MQWPRDLFRPPPPDELERMTWTPRELYRWGITHGWTRDQAGDLAAWTVRLERTRTPWSYRTVIQLDFLRWLYETGRLGDTRTSSTTSESEPLP